MVLCSNCGNEAGENYFCPNCGSKIIKPEPSTHDNNTNTENPQPSDSESHSTNAKYENDFIDNLMDFDDEISGKFSGIFKNKTMDKILDKTTSYQSLRYKVYQNRSTLEKTEPVFLEVYDSVDDEFVKDILMLERSAMSTTSSVIGIVASQIYTPTKDLPHDKAVKFYEDMVEVIVREIEQEKQKGTFDEEIFYKNKIKQLTIDNTSVLGISKSMKAFKKNQG